MPLLKRLLFAFLILVALDVCAAPVHANTLGSTSDVITTSRPSPSTPLSADAASGVATVSITNNGSTFLASDSATFYGGTLETLTVATVSAAKTNLFFTTNTVNSHNNGTVVATPITAMHTVKFTTQTSIPANGSVQILFPAPAATDTNPASPSAVAFMFNGLAGTNVKTNGITCNSNAVITQTAGTTSSIVCNTTSAVSGGTTITFLIGCSSATVAVCNTQVPTLINPTKTAVNGTADTWKVIINTWSATGATGTILDNSQIKIGTIESVLVEAHIDPTFTFVISGVADGTLLNTVCTNGGANPDTTNTLFGTTPNEVNLGTLTAAQVNHAAQKMIITSNAISGYSITATSSGHLINPANGYYIPDAQGTPTANDTPTPNGAVATIGTGSNRFGIHPCELTAQNKLNTTTWGGSTPYFANPSAAFYYTLVNSASGPAASGDTFYVEYAASPQGSTPPGDYRTVLTYVASTIF